MVADDKLRLAAQALGITDPDAIDRAVGVLGMVDEGEGLATSKPVATELEAALAEHEGPGEEVAHIGPVAIRVRPITPGQMMRFTTAIGGTASDAGVGMGQLIRAVVHPDDLDACWEAIDAEGWSVERSIEWVQSHVEVATGRPTSPSSLSRAQRRHPGASLNGVSTPSIR